MNLRFAATIALASLLTGAGSAAAQQIPLAPDTLRVDTLLEISPRNAFLRSTVVPGWGQATAGSYFRGGVFFAIQSTSWYMLGKTLGKLSEARDREKRRVALATDSLNQLIAEDTALARRFAENPALFEEAIDQNGRVSAARAHIESRERHRQDWITYVLFFTMMSGVDAYVNAHLTDFPVELSGQTRSDGAFVVQASFRLGSAR